MERLNNFTKGIRPEWQKNYQEVIEEVAFDLTKNIGQDSLNISGQEQPEVALEQKGILASFKKLIGKKMLIFISMGLLNLSDPAKESYANQLKMIVQENQTLEFFIENGVTKEKLKSFEEGLELEEPEFLKWVMEQEVVVGREIDSLTESVLNYTPQQEKQDANSMIESMAVLAPNFEQDVINKTLSGNKKIFEFLMERKDEFVQINNFIKENLRAIILITALTNDSKEGRQALTRSYRFPNIRFLMHHWLQFTGAKGFMAPVSPEKFGSNDLMWNPEMGIMPTSFWNDTSIDFNRYLNVFIHEYSGHFMQFGSEDPKIFFPMSLMRANLVEGLAHSTTFQIVGYLAREYPDLELKPTLSFSKHYDLRLITVAILESILKATSDENHLARWNLGMMDDDELIENLTKSLKSLGLTVNIARLVASLNREDQAGENDRDLVLVSGLLSELNLKGIELSPMLVRKLLQEGYKFENWQIQQSDVLVENIYRMINRKQK